MTSRGDGLEKNINGRARCLLYYRPGMLCNSGRIGEARPIAREHRIQGLRSFFRQSQVFPDCLLDLLGS